MSARLQLAMVVLGAATVIVVGAVVWRNLDSIAFVWLVRWLGVLG